MNTRLALLISWLLAGSAEAQITYFAYPGGSVNCIGPNGQHSLQQDLGSGMGVISGQRSYDSPSYMETYAIILPPVSRPSVALPQAPQAPRTPSFQSGGGVDALYGLDQPLYLPYSFGGEGQ